MKTLLLLTDDNFLAEVLGTYVRRDGIEVVRVASTAEMMQIRGVAAILIDIAKRGIAGGDIIAVSQRAERAGVPMLVISSQSRRELSEFAAVVRAADVLSKSEKMPAIAARLRLWVNKTRIDDREAPSGFAIPELAVASM